MKHMRLPALAMLVILAGCSSLASRPPAGDIEDACLLLQRNKDWYEALRRTARAWGAPMGYQLAVIRQESSFTADARPPRGPGQWFGLVAGDYISSAMGYSQALDATWRQYQQETGRLQASRTRFSDAADFVGWYFSTNGQRLGVGQYDYSTHCLIHHEGAAGYKSGAWRTKTWLVDTAAHLAAQAARYESQITACGALRQRREFLGLF